MTAMRYEGTIPARDDVHGAAVLVPFIERGSPAIVTHRHDYRTNGWSEWCGVVWPDDVYASTHFGSAMRRA